MAALKSNKLKTSLAAKAKENATVTRGTRGEQTELKKGVPAEHSRKHLDGETPVVGVSIGITKNMDNYESLRADVWLTDKKQDNETLEEAYSRVAKITSEVLQEIVGEYI